MPAKVCEYCRSVVSRDGLELTSLGKIAVLPEDVSPLQIGVHGQWEGSAYAIVGRLRWRWAAGRSLQLLRMQKGKRVAPQIQRTRSDDLLASVFPHASACP